MTLQTLEIIKSSPDEQKQKEKLQKEILAPSSDQTFLARVTLHTTQRGALID